MWTRTDDPVEDFNACCRDRERAVRRAPVCCECEQPILTEECYQFDGELICPECLSDNHLKCTENYIA